MGLAPHSDAPKVSSQRFSAPPVSTAPDGRTLRATRWVVVDDDEARLQAVATCLRQMGAKVETTALRGFQPKLGALRCFDAIGYIVGERELRSASQLLKVLEGDARLRWMRLVVVRWTEVFEPESTGVSAETLTRSLEQHWESEWESLEQLIQGLELGVERLGIPRILVAVGRLPGPLTLRVASLQHDFALELSEGRLLRLEMDDQAVQPKQLDAGMDQLLQLSEGSAVLEATPQRQSETLAPQGGLAPLGELLRAHAERLGKHSLFSGAAPLSTVGAEEPRVSARWAAFSSWLSAALDPFQGRTVHLKRLAELLRSYRAPIAAGALAMVLACAAMAVLVSRDPSVPRLVAPLRTEAQLNSDAELANPAAANGATRQAATLTGVESQRGALGEPRAEGAEPPSVTAQCEHLGPKGQLPPGQRAAQAKSAWRLGRKSLLVGDLALAAERMCLSALLDPQGAGAADLVRLHFTRGDIPSARAGAEWALAEQPGEPTVKQLLADALNQDGDTEGARQLLLDSMGLPPGESGKIAKVAQRFAVAGNQVLKGGDAAQAERMFRRAVALNRDNLTGTVGLADLLLRRKQVAAASPFAKRAAALGPQNFHAQLLLGEVLSAEGESEAAKAAFQVALRLNPTSARVRQRLGIE
jgi:Flp pilus assembly protein TadD